ncbi:MAG: peptide-methionine (S)-S-oxide reductase MsrA [Candidatus Latescibacterota bacterium]|nr:MAG: peptide-methionine (S)-S-oxide reductase MsrA [Candidatus Latescibacterota bacterium]
MEPTRSHEMCTLGGGCFWCLEAAFEQLRGIESVVSGYAGGATPNPSYELVCTGTSGHAEVVQLRFDPEVITFGEILRVFFTIHDPTTLNRQGNDIGTQYRSVIFYHTADQKRISQETIEALQREGLWNDPIVTEVTPLEHFYPAEAYHQEYYRKNPQQPYCAAIVAPKVAKVRTQFMQQLKR